MGALHLISQQEASMRLRSADEVKDVLSDLDFPASKEEIVEHARHRAGADSGATRALKALPLGEYDSLREVLRSVPTDPAPERTESERQSQHRQHRHSGLAEHMRDADLPVVEDELRKDT
jgi:hypothetical protein